MNLPNGFGSVYKLSGKRRKPFVARKTTGWTFDEVRQKSFPIYVFIGYYATRKEALTALTEFNKDPYDLKSHKLTFSDVYDLWSEEHFASTSKSNVKNLKNAYKICADLHDIQFSEIKLAHMQHVIDSSGKNKPTLDRVKVLLNLMYGYAVKHEIVTKDKKDLVTYIDTTKAGNPDSIEHRPFSKAEIDLLWKYVDKYPVPLMMIYTGVRISEFRTLRREDIQIDKRCFYIRKAKTEAGIREVPICEKIVPLFQKCLSESDFLFPNSKGKVYVDQGFRDNFWIPAMKELQLQHTPHDTRHTCISLMTEAGIDQRIIQQIVGHKGDGVTQEVYTHIDLQTKLKAINLI